MALRAASCSQAWRQANGLAEMKVHACADTRRRDTDPPLAGHADRCVTRTAMCTLHKGCATRAHGHERPADCALRTHACASLATTLRTHSSLPSACCDVRGSVLLLKAGIPACMLHKVDTVPPKVHQGMHMCGSRV